MSRVQRAWLDQIVRKVKEDFFRKITGGCCMSCYDIQQGVGLEKLVFSLRNKRTDEPKNHRKVMETKQEKAPYERIPR